MKNYLNIICVIISICFFSSYNLKSLNAKYSISWKKKCPLSYSLKAKRVKFPFYVYKGYGAIGQLHYFPTGRMGDVLTIRIWGFCKKAPYSGISCIKVVYDVSDPKKNQQHWAGVFWLNPANNWGDVPDMGYDLRGAEKLIFYAKGEKGGELIKFTMGGVHGQFSDTGDGPEISVTLTKKWMRYEIPLEGIDLSYIIGGFCWSANDVLNRNGAVFFLDEIYYTD